MPKSLHHCCRIYCSLDAEITALVVAENTALLIAVHTVYAPDPSNETSKPFYVKIGYSKYYHLENIALDWNKVMKRYEPLLQSNVNETFTRSWAD